MRSYIDLTCFRTDINCFMSIFNSPCVKVISEDFAFDKNTEKPCPMY